MDKAEILADRERYLFPCVTPYYAEPLVALARALAAVAPPGLSKSFFTNSGTEANETATLLAQVYTGQTEVVALRHSYSGRSLLAMSLTGQAPWRLVSGPVAGVRHLAAPYCYRCPFRHRYPDCDLACAHDLEEVISTTTNGRPAAFIAEPVLGVGGFIVPPPGYFEVVAEIIHRHGGLLIADEVQTGFGRTGTMFGIEHWEVTPDVMTFAKGLGDGTPIGATLARPEVAEAMRGLSISTFGGNPVSCTAALATLEVIQEEHLVENAATVGAYLRQRLDELADRHPAVGDVRGLGLMQGLELVHHRESKEPAADYARAVLEETRRRGLLVGKGGMWGNVLRIAPPMSTTTADVDEAVAALAAALATLPG